MLSRNSLCFGFALLSVVSVSPLWAQNAAPVVEFPAASPRGVVKQRVGVTDIELSYSRPSARGREIFGQLVPYGEVWRTGADVATKLTLSTAAKLNGVDVAAGDYELFTIPGETEWTFILQNARGQWGSYGYDPANDVVRFTAQPQRLAEPVESLSFGINDLDTNGATLSLTWENTRVPVKIAVDTTALLVPQIEAAMASDAAEKPYFGAAMFYYANDLDLDQALAWMEAGLKAQPEAFWMIYRHGLLLEKKGDKAGAIAAAEQSKALAEKANPPELREEYIRLNQALIDRVKATQ